MRPDIIKAQLVQVHRNALKSGWTPFRHARASNLAAQLRQARKPRYKTCCFCPATINGNNKSGACRNCRNPRFKSTPKLTS